VAELDSSGFTAYAWFRLLTIASEDVGLADSNVAVEVNALHDAALKAQQRRGGNGTMQLIHATLVLVRAPKSRIVDHALTAMYGDQQPTPIADVAIDKHTPEGRQRGRGWEHWWSEATLLADRATGELTYAPHLPDPYRERAMALRGGQADPAQNRLSPPGQLSMREEDR
jgi:hypothetical protein